jgi:hypothetical protein
MSHAGDPVDAPEIEDVDGENNQSDTGHDESTADEIDDLDGERDSGGDTDDDLEDDAAGTDAGQAGGSDQVGGKKRGNPEYGVLRKRAREAEAEKAALQARLEALEQGTRRQSQAEQDAAERARLELMSPDERTDYLVSKTRNEVQNEIRQLRFEQSDIADRTRFDGLCSRKPHFADIADDVESELTRLRRQGGNSTRETVALYLIGKRADERAGRAKGKQVKQGKQNIDRQTAKPSGGRSDIRGGDERRGGNDRTARAKRLDGQTI